MGMTISILILYVTLAEERIPIDAITDEQIPRMDNVCVAVMKSRSM